MELNNGSNKKITADETLLINDVNCLSVSDTVKLIVGAVASAGLILTDVIGGFFLFSIFGAVLLIITVLSFVFKLRAVGKTKKIIKNKAFFIVENEVSYSLPDWEILFFNKHGDERYIERIQYDQYISAFVKKHPFDFPEKGEKCYVFVSENDVLLALPSDAFTLSEELADLLVTGAESVGEKAPLSLSDISYIESPNRKIPSWYGGFVLEKSTLSDKRSLKLKEGYSLRFANAEYPVPKNEYDRAEQGDEYYLFKNDSKIILALRCDEVEFDETVFEESGKQRT